MNELLVSNDGSHTIRSEQFNVTYHSTYGAIEESMTVFINAGLRYKLETQSKVNILEMGFGTGLNPLLTLSVVKDLDVNIIYTGVEAYPITRDIMHQLNYPSVIDGVSVDDFMKMHGKVTTDNISNLKLRSNFEFNKLIGKIEDLPLSGSFDLIYYDAFAPRSQPELWNEEILSKIYSLTADKGILTTYCAQGAFKRALKSVGFKVEGLPGPTGKREMTRAIKNA